MRRVIFMSTFLVLLLPVTAAAASAQPAANASSTSHTNATVAATQKTLQQLVAAAEHVRMMGIANLSSELAAASSSAHKAHVDAQNVNYVFTSGIVVFWKESIVSLLSALLAIFSVPLFFYGFCCFVSYAIYLAFRQLL